MEKMKKLYIQYKRVILYIVFGGLTTICNIVTYAVCSKLFGLGVEVSTLIAWILSVTFAYVTNRTLVFESKANSKQAIFKELVSFFSCRLLTGLLDFVIMYVCVKKLNMNDMIIKVLSNVLVIIANYVASKLLIFKHGGSNEKRV